MKGKLFAAALLGLGVLSGQSVEKPFSGDARPPRSIQLGSQLIAELKPGIADQAEIVIADVPIRVNNVSHRFHRRRDGHFQRRAVAAERM